MPAPLATRDRARSLRRRMTPPEVRLWVRLRQSGSPKFRRQHPVGPYILDFYCAEARLAVEVDGSFHGLDARAEQDRRRGAWLASEGIQVIRIAAAAVMSDPDQVAGDVLTTAMGMRSSRA